ncbi:MAG: glycine dehydrogenase (aminomethyl-transferring), partial [Ruaniaceae bacterium]|nr:glycine dehydrogenase (aminomethyl-transferring) [Ruaniaceae bacterium]
MTYTERHIGASASDRTAMLEVIKAENLDALLRAAVPPSIYEPAPAAGIPAGASEEQVLARLRQIASKNVVRVSMIGQGYYDTITPAVIQRNILENPAWYTAYTPYQPEISQGRLEALLNFQTMVGDLTGLPIAGASMLDEATAAAEAMLLARRASKAKGSRFYVERDTFAQTRAVIETRANAVGLEIVEFDAADAPTFEGAFGVLIQQPGASGRVLDDGTLTRIAVSAHEANALVAVALDLLAAILIGAPG